MSTHTPATWGTRLGFILASAGSAVGLGAIWKFPYMAGTNGGSVFMLPYIFFTLTVGVALLLAEFAMGRAGRRGAVGSLNRAAGKPWGIFGGIGVFAIPEMGRFYRHVLIQKRYPHHGAVAFGHYGKLLFEVFKFLGVADIAYNQPKSLPYPTENPFA